MSGPVRAEDLATVEAAPTPPTGPAVELTPSRLAQVGTTTVRRALPTRRRRTVGPWCFLDHALEELVGNGDLGLQVGPHPHIGLQTVTWLISGEVVHRDSLGSEQVIRPGELNVMSAGRGVAHAEETPSSFRGRLHGTQLWVAQPDLTRNGPAAFEHHDELPQVELAAATATVMIGGLAGTESPARRDTDLIGVELVLRPGRSVVPVQPEHEHAIVLIDGVVTLGEHVVETDHLAYLGSGRDELVIIADDRARALLIGGAPFEAPPVMWWNFVARDHQEIDAAYVDWQSGNDRFGAVTSTLATVPAPPPPWSRASLPFHRR